MPYNTQARLALAIIIGNNRFSSSFRATSSHKRVSAGESADASSLGPEVDDTAAGEEGEGEEMQGGNFKQHVHDIFMARFSEEMRETCGVKVIDMSIEDIQITTKELRLACVLSRVVYIYRTALYIARPCPLFLCCACIPHRHVHRLTVSLQSE